MGGVIDELISRHHSIAMTDKDIVKQLKGLKQIKPDQAWVSSVKTQIIGAQSSQSILDVFSGVFSYKKLAYASLSLVVFLVSAFGFAQSTVPGDFLFPIKRIAEKSQGALLGSADQSNHNLDIANNRLQELTVIVEENRAGNITPAIQEYKESVSEVTKSLANNTGTFKDIAVRVKSLQVTKTNLETLGVVMVQESDNLNNALAPLVENEIKVLDTLSASESLTTDQEIRLVEVKSHYKKGEYTAALEKILLITNLK